jgi:hypothetical protein
LCFWKVLIMSSTAIVRTFHNILRRVARLELAALIVGAIAILGLVARAEAQDVCTEAAENGEDAATEQECIVPRPPSRLRPTFSEEEERGFQERSFADSFLSDALTGMADPLGGGSVGGDVEGDMILDELEPGDRGFTLEPGFDPTNVIIPLDAVSK